VAATVRSIAETSITISIAVNVIIFTFIVITTGRTTTTTLIPLLILVFLLTVYSLLILRSVQNEIENNKK
jgi:hypothetical protein